MSNVEQPEEGDEFEEGIEYYILQYNTLIAKEGHNLNPAAACVILLCTAIDCSVSALINTLTPNTADETGFEDDG